MADGFAPRCGRRHAGCAGHGMRWLHRHDVLDPWHLAGVARSVRVVRIDRRLSCGICERSLVGVLGQLHNGDQRCWLPSLCRFGYVVPRLMLACRRLSAGVVPDGEGGGVAKAVGDVPSHSPVKAAIDVRWHEPRRSLCYAADRSNTRHSCRFG